MFFWWWVKKTWMLVIVFWISRNTRTDHFFRCWSPGIHQSCTKKAFSRTGVLSSTFAVELWKACRAPMQQKLSKRCWYSSWTEPEIAPSFDNSITVGIGCGYCICLCNVWTKAVFTCFCYTTSLISPSSSFMLIPISTRFCTFRFAPAGWKRYCWWLQSETKRSAGHAWPRALWPFWSSWWSWLRYHDTIVETCFSTLFVGALELAEGTSSKKDERGSEGRGGGKQFMGDGSCNTDPELK